MNFTDPKLYLLAAALLILLILWAAASHTKRAVNARLRRKMRKGGFMHWSAFEQDWIIDRKDGAQTGYKYNDRPGCYIIMIFAKPVRGKRFVNYENIYIGQSVNVCQRVHNHFNGKGNGDVYADIKYGKEAYVRIVPCKAKRLNDMETALIEAFSATDSYNKTKGGAKVTRLR